MLIWHQLYVFSENSCPRIELPYLIGTAQTSNYLYIENMPTLSKFSMCMWLALPTGNQHWRCFVSLANDGKITFWATLWPATCMPASWIPESLGIQCLKLWPCNSDQKLWFKSRLLLGHCCEYDLLTFSLYSSYRSNKTQAQEVS